MLAARSTRNTLADLLPDKAVGSVELYLREGVLVAVDAEQIPEFTAAPGPLSVVGIADLLLF